MAFNGIFDKEAPVTVSYETWNKMVTAADRLETLVTLILDDSTLDGSEEGLMYDNDCGCFGALSYLKAVYYDEYQAKLAQEKELYGTHDEADAEPEPTIVTVHVSKEKLSDELKAKLTAALFEEEEVDG